MAWREGRTSDALELYRARLAADPEDQTAMLRVALVYAWTERFDLSVDLLDQLIERLEAGGFFRTPELKPTTVNNLQALFQRAEASEQEIRTLRGIVRALERAGANSVSQETPPRERSPRETE